MAKQQGWTVEQWRDFEKKVTGELDCLRAGVTEARRRLAMVAQLENPQDKRLMMATVMHSVEAIQASENFVLCAVKDVVLCKPEGTHLRERTAAEVARMVRVS